jgi:FixJ family two-component response regulator
MHQLVLSPQILEIRCGDITMMSSPIRIAILDDDLSVRTALTRLLKTSAMNVSAYASCIELLTSLEKDHPDCLVLDLQMPGMNGLDVMNYLSHAGIRFPIVVITAHDEIGSRETCLAAGAFAYLRKPLDADELIKTIMDATATRR